MKRLMAIFLVIMMLFSTAWAETAESGSGNGQLTLEDIQVFSGGTARVHMQDGHVTFVEGACTDKPVRNMDDAAAVVESMRELLGGDGNTHFEPWKELKDPFGNVYYVFQQTYADTIVLGGAVKVMTDDEGSMTGLTGSVTADLPETETSEGLTGEQAELLVIRHEKEVRHVDVHWIEGMTRRVVLPVDRVLDMEAEEYYTRFVWAVYTDNPSAGRGDDLPYLAHYVTMGGEYLYSLPTLLPGDMAGNAGYDASYAFQFMEPVEYTGYVDWSDGTEKEISVTLMRDTRTGMYYLGNIEHRIVVADCWEFLYNGGQVKMEYSEDNLEWDQVGLQSLYNYCRVYDYYEEIGWKGPDGEGTPIMILKDFCDEDHNPIDNAAYAGKFYGWQCFLSSSINDLSQCLDVCAHEFTHGVTDSVMTYNAYMNDYGAINEALSDIQGNLCEMLMKATEDEAWTVGEHSEVGIRSMSDPNQYSQPAHSWDMYYQPNVLVPTDINDHGGVHVNSSLLNNLAYRLCTDGGMTLEEARAYWFAVDCALVPGSDYAQLRELLPWMLERTGLSGYQQAMKEALSATRLGDGSEPETIGAEEAMLELNLPDNEVFQDGNWILTVMNVNTGRLREIVNDLKERFETRDFTGLPRLFERFAKEPEVEVQEETEEKGFWQLFVEALMEQAEEEETVTEEVELSPEVQAEVAEAQQWLRGLISEVFTTSTVAAGADGHTIHAMSRPGRTFPCLLYVKVKPNSDELEKIKAVIYLNGHWVDVTGLFQDPEEDENALLGMAKKLLESELLSDLVSIVVRSRSLEDYLNAFTFQVPGGAVTELPATGLDVVTLEGTMPILEDVTEEVVNTKSRPKLTENGD